MTTCNRIVRATLSTVLFISGALAQSPDPNAADAQFGQPDPKEREEIHQILTFLGTIDAERSATLRQLYANDRIAFFRHMEGLKEWIEHMYELRVEDGQLFELEKSSYRLNRECERLAEVARDSQGATHDTHVADLRKALERLFESRLAIRQYELERLEAELGEVRRQIQKMRSAPDEMITRRLNAMLADDDW